VRHDASPSDARAYAIPVSLAYAGLAGCRRRSAFTAICLRLGLCSPWIGRASWRSPYLRDLADDRQLRRSPGRRRRDTIRRDRQSFGIRCGAALPDRLAFSSSAFLSAWSATAFSSASRRGPAHHHHEVSCRACSAWPAVATTSSTGRSGWRVKSGISICLYWRLGSPRSCSCFSVNGFCWQAGRLTVVALAIPAGNPVRASVAGDSCYRKHPERTAGLRGAQIRDAGIRRAISHRGRMSVAGLYRGCFGGSEFWPRSMAIVLMSGRSFWDWEPPTSPLHLAMAIPLPADCRNPPSMMRRERARRWRWWFCSLALAFACFSYGLLTNLPKRCWRALSLRGLQAGRRAWRCFACGGSAGSISSRGRSRLCPCCCSEPARCSARPLCIDLPLLGRASRPNIAFLGRLPGTGAIPTAPGTRAWKPLVGVIAFRPEASLL